MKLVVNADDFGYTKGVTEGIIEGYHRGIVRSTTALTNMPWLELGKNLTKDCQDLGIGVHMTLTLGKALTGVKSFTDDQGNFLSKARIQSMDLNQEEVYEEWKAQIERFREVFGRMPAHLDSHHHMHVMNEKLRETAQRLAGEYHLALRRFCPYEFVSGFYGETVSREGFLELLRQNAGKDIEIMVHPGYCDLELYRRSSYNLARVQELDILCSDEVLAYIKAEGIELTHY
ncbi:MAG: chitin disaccharide deacetylase [Hungatella sp.]|nr:chitin disaccharide deacetylase [Hungatella sp.]